MTNLDRLVAVIAQLRSPEGCSWDRAQTLRSMRPYLLEEAYEVLDAINLPDDDGAKDALLAEELGDLLFNVLMLIQIAHDNGRTTLDQVAAQISDKMVTRHPHVFDPSQRHVEGGTLAVWEAIKNRKKDRKSRLDGIPRALPALLRAHRQGEKASLVGFDWQEASGVFDKLSEELGELHEAIADGDQAAVEAEYGDVLMSAANLGRHIGANPEDALQGANDRFYARFARVEAIAKSQGIDLQASDEAALDALWEQAKRELRGD